MKKANVEKLEHMAATYLQHKYRFYLSARNQCGVSSREAAIAWDQYSTACDTIRAFGADWLRRFTGEAGKDDWDISNYEHTVKFPTDAACDRLNLDAWVD